MEVGDKNKFNCTRCDKAIKTRWGLDRHLKVCHGQQVVKRRYGKHCKYKCPLCGTILKDFEQYRDHVLKSHEIRIQMDFFRFESQSRFVAWKRKVEKETKSSFVREAYICSDKNKPVLEESKPCIAKKVGVIHFKCHRSGNFKIRKEESERKRNFKAQGSAKINAHCPAKISAEFKRNGSVKATYCSTHIGHECEVSHLRLTEQERREIVAKIAAKIPFDVILDEIRNTAGSSNISRMHLLSKRDLWTISHSSYFKKYSQSVKSLLPSKNDQSNVGLLADNSSLQDSPSNTKSDDIEEFEDTEMQTFNPNDSDSDSDMSSNCAEVGNNQLHRECNVSPSSVIEYKKLRTNTGRSASFQSQPVSPCNKLSLDGLPLSKKQSLAGLSTSQKQSLLIEKFRTNVNNLTSTKEIKWVENHINRMFILLKSMKGRTRTEIGIKDAEIRREEKVLKTSHPSPNLHSSKLMPSSKVHAPSQGVRSQLFLPHHSPNLHSSKLMPSSKVHAPSQGVRSQLFLPMCAPPQSSKPKFDFQSRLVKCSPALETGTGDKKSICHPTQQSAGDRKATLKTVDAPKTEISCSAQIKQYLVPIAGKPDKFLIVQTKPNEPPPVGPLTPVTPNQKLTNNKNAVFIDHSYSL